MAVVSFRTLPPEIWLVIVDMAVEASIIPDEICDYSNFARVSEISDRYNRPVIAHSWGNLRLVCREFKALAEETTTFSLGRQGLQKSTRYVNISSPSSAPSCMEQLVRHPNNYKIVALAINYGCTQNEQDRVIRSLLQHGTSLPNVRKLAVTLTTGNHLTVWGNVNDAFPSLTTLVLYVNGTPSYAAEPTACSVTFQKLKILSMATFVPPVGVEFPALRHVSLEDCSQRTMEFLVRCPRLESLLMRTMDRHVQFDWKRFPNLRLLGLPTTSLWIATRCPKHHPMSHLALYVSGGWCARRLVEPTMERLPSTTKITLNLDHFAERHLDGQYLDIIARGCASAGLELVGSPYGVTRRSAIFITGMVPVVFTDAVESAANTLGSLLIFPLFVILCCIQGDPFD